ncbi:hypothetical protein ACQR50_07325 [Sphingomonas sp. Xoc002]|uniref:hypothetical protein n=1 Tax=Sphingomonas sp. Xoc002 TaxID=2837624 RepID=UPI003D16D4BC
MELHSMWRSFDLKIFGKGAGATACNGKLAGLGLSTNDDGEAIVINDAAITRPSILHAPNPFMVGKLPSIATILQDVSDVLP